MADTEKIRMNSVYQGAQQIENPFLSIFINDYIKKFRSYNADGFIITISGLKRFIPEGDPVLTSLFEQLKQYDFTIENEGDHESINQIDICCKNNSKNSVYSFKYQIHNLPSIVEHSSKTDIPIAGIITIKVIAEIISKLKILYKAIALDLDETLWCGTLLEDGIEKIRENMLTQKGVSYIEFMKLIKKLGNEFGIYITICSRNENKIVESAINSLQDDIFPLKNQIDYIVANNNDKSENIRLLAEQLSILPGSIVFIDDNQIVRDEVKNKLPEVFVPEWENHTDLVTKLFASCVFERGELSLNSQNRRKQYRIIQVERVKNSLPKLSVKVFNDQDHIESIRLYSKSNQFKTSLNDNNFHNEALSIYFELIRENGENLGICSAITYSHKYEYFHIINWAVSCRYFEIGLEEFVLLYIYKIANKDKILIDYNDSEYNQKVVGLLDKYSSVFNVDRRTNQIELFFTEEVVQKINQNTNLSTI